MVGQRGVHDRQRADEVHGGAQTLPGERLDRLVEALAQPGGSRRAAVQVEDRGADLLYHPLQLIDGVGQTLLHLYRAGPRDRPLQ